MGIECHRNGAEDAHCPVGGGKFRLCPVKSDAEAKVQRVHIEDRAYRFGDPVHPVLGKQGVLFRAFSQVA